MIPKGHRSIRFGEMGKARVGAVLTLLVAAVAIIGALLVWSPWAGAVTFVHGIGFSKGCDTPTNVGDPYQCTFSVQNSILTDTAGDTLTFNSITDTVSGYAPSGNLLSSLTVDAIIGTASCNVSGTATGAGATGNTLCTLPSNTSITFESFALHTVVSGDLPGPLTDSATLFWLDTCSSGAPNCPSTSPVPPCPDGLPTGTQCTTTSSQSALQTLTPTNTATATATDTATATATDTATATATNTATATATLTPTPTNTPPHEDKVKMSLRVYGDERKDRLVCDTGDVNRKCTVAGFFSVDVLASQPPPAGYTAFQVVLQYSGDVVLQPQRGLSESRAPACFFGTEDGAKPADGVPGWYALTCKVGPPPITYSGPLANVVFSCPDAGGSGQIDIVAGAGPKVSAYVNPGIKTKMFFLKSVSKGGKPVADSVMITCTDPPPPTPTPTPTPIRPSCADVQKVGPAFWSFYDVWTRPSGSPSTWARDGSVSIIDVGAVARRFGATDHGGTDPVNRNSDPLSLPTNDTDYHPDYDRGSPLPSGALGPPDGSINIPNDILGVGRQYGLACS